MTYSEQLAQRKQEAAEQEAAWVEHFGPEASNYANWDSLWWRGYLELLTNPSPTATYHPKGLPTDWVGGWIAMDGHSAGAYAPNLYGDKFLFYFARQLANGKAELVATATELLTDTDEMDCDRFTEAIDNIATYLHSPVLYYIAGSGHRSEVGKMKPDDIEAFFLKWDSSKHDAGLFITWLGVAIPNRRVVPTEVAKGKLQAVRRQIENRQQQLQMEVATQRVEVGSVSTREKTARERKSAKLAQGVEPSEVLAVLTNLGLGSTYDSPGEWAAAFRALFVAGVLNGNAPAAFRWAVQYARASDTMLETFKKSWQNELSEVEQFANDAQKVVFRNVLASAQRLVSTKGHK